MGQSGWSRHCGAPITRGYLTWRRRRQVQAERPRRTPSPRHDVLHEIPQRPTGRPGCQAKVAADFILAVDVCRSCRGRDPASVAIVLLLAIASGAKPGTDRANARLDAVRTGLAVGAGVGAAAGLALAFRRQHHQEVATDLTDRDATERRITELYIKAVEQLGSDKAPVRLGGLYALERLAQDNPAHRQTIVNVICAYLRMPFSAPGSGPEASEDPTERGTQADLTLDPNGAPRVTVTVWISSRA
jgi:hypothetical protein